MISKPWPKLRNKTRVNDPDLEPHNAQFLTTHKTWLHVHESAEHRDGCQGGASSNFWGRLMMNCFPLKFQQAESDKQNICHIKADVRDKQEQFAHNRASTAKTERSRRSNAAAEWQRKRNRRGNDKQINERRKRIGWKWGWKWNIWGWNNAHKERKE